jgi:hypothetical protein
VTKLVAIADADPVPGYYALRRMNRPTSVVRIWHGPPCDPVTGEVLDRSWRLQATLNGSMVDDMSTVWPWCAKEPIDRGQHDFIVAQTQAAAIHMPGSALAKRAGRSDWETQTLLV